MKKTTLLLCLALLLICALVAPAAAFSGAGSGTTGDPYQITTRAQLEEISSEPGASYRLETDIDLGGSSTPWTPIGTSAAKFTGTFDGNGHTISNMYIIDTGTSSRSFFGYSTGTTIENTCFVSPIVAPSAQSHNAVIIGTGSENTINNISITNANVSGTNYCGLIIGGSYYSNIIQDCYGTGSVTGAQYVGGLVGNPQMSAGVTTILTRCYTNTIVTGTDNVGGIAGTVYSVFTGNGISKSVLTGGSVTSGTSSARRIIYFQGTGSIPIATSYALNTVLVNGATVSSSDPASQNGASVTAANLATQSWWETYPGWSFSSTSAWYWDAINNIPKLKIFGPPYTIQITTTPTIAYYPSPIQLNATIAGSGTITYLWQHSTDDISYTNLSTGTTYISTGQTTISYITTPTTSGTHYYKLTLTNTANKTSTSDATSIQQLQPYTPNTITTQSSPDITTESTDQYHVQTQYILPGSPNKLVFIDQLTAYMAVGNAVYKIQSDTNTITAVSSTTGNTIQNAYLGTTNAIITDTENNTALYDYASGTQTYISSSNTGVIASTAIYAAVKNISGSLNLYAANGTYINATSTTATQIAANDQTNIITGHAGSTTLYIWQPSATTITQTTKTMSYAITDIKQIPGTNQFIVTTTAKSYILAITEIGNATTVVTSTDSTPLIHTQSTTADTFIGTATNGISIIDNTGTTIGTYTAGATLNDASIARLTGLWAVSGGDDTQAYFLTKSGTSSWTLGQTAQIMSPVSHTQISTTGTYSLICSGLNLYLFKNALIPTTLYYLNGIVIASSGMPWQNQSITMNGETITTDSSGKFVTLVTPGTTYTFVADTTTTQYTATNSQLQTIAIQLKPNPYATAITYTAAYNATSGNIEMAYGDTTGKTESVTWSIYDTNNKSTVYTHTGTVGTETYTVPLEDSYKNYQVTVTADRGDTSVKNTWTLTPSGSSPINLFGLDDTGKNLIFCAVLMIFGGLFGVLHSTKGALAVTAFAAWMRYMELITVPWILISIAAVIAILASLQRGGEGKS